MFYIYTPFFDQKWLESKQLDRSVYSPFDYSYLPKIRYRVTY